MSAGIATVAGVLAVVLSACAKQTAHEQQITAAGTQSCLGCANTRRSPAAPASVGVPEDADVPARRWPRNQDVHHP